MERELFEVHSSMTNTIEGSSVIIDVNTERICPNMTNKEFREMAERLIGWANVLLRRRLDDLRRNDAKTKERMRKWFGRDDATTRAYLLDGFTKVSAVMSDLKPTHLIRVGSDEDRALGCAPNVNNLDGEAAHVCSPNIQNRRIAIGLQFCNVLTDYREFQDSRVSTLIHEVTHFGDTFASGDPRYVISTPLALWGQSNQDLALKNADSLAAFVIYDEKQP
ncbi:peptidase M35 [Caballeronia catudaia]|uniref:Peptidase M35 n=1 Tax=Caballeronia catudaia TaxID=1777136 RepID=A0A158B352_9BURK|nr:M35 family metallo-endopeptidase [Caballeronia catudaia]SAK64156.1 peptidase M35 [Caballeronia catudaia]